MQLRASYTTLGTWRAVGDAYSVPARTAWRIANTDYEPKSSSLRLRLGLPALAPAPVCPRHGIVHTRKTCPRPRRYRDLWDIPTTELRRMLEERL